MLVLLWSAAVPGAGCWPSLKEGPKGCSLKLPRKSWLKNRELVVGKGHQTHGPQFPAPSFSGDEDKQAPPAQGWLKWQFAWGSVEMYQVHLCALLSIGSMEMALPEVILTGYHYHASPGRRGRGRGRGGGGINDRLWHWINRKIMPLGIWTICNIIT